MEYIRLSKDCRVDYDQIKKAVKMFPSISAFGEALGISYQSAYALSKGVNRPTIPQILKIERLTKRKITAESIAPDLMWDLLKEKNIIS
jgi:DNA-binding transcriptional regulator YdaS (Cro superfamily)